MMVETTSNKSHSRFYFTSEQHSKLMTCGEGGGVMILLFERPGALSLIGNYTMNGGNLRTERRQVVHSADRKR